MTAVGPRAVFSPSFFKNVPTRCFRLSLNELAIFHPLFSDNQLFSLSKLRRGQMVHSKTIGWEDARNRLVLRALVFPIVLPPQTSRYRGRLFDRAQSLVRFFSILLPFSKYLGPAATPLLISMNHGTPPFTLSPAPPFRKLATVPAFAYWP